MRPQGFTPGAIVLWKGTRVIEPKQFYNALSNMLCGAGIQPSRWTLSELPHEDCHELFIQFIDKSFVRQKLRRDDFTEDNLQVLRAKIIMSRP